MSRAAKPTRQNRTITVHFHDETTYAALLGNTNAFVEFVLAFLLSLGFQLGLAGGNMRYDPILSIALSRK